MAKTIIESVKAKSATLVMLKEPEPGDPPPADPPLSKEARAALFQEAEDLSKLATRAIIEGRFSLAWRQYMLKFVDQGDPISGKQLARLLADDDTVGDEDMNRRRAYLLGNAICGGPSTTDGADLAFTVAGIDNGL